jgi:hypothetical protein
LPLVRVKSAIHPLRSLKVEFAGRFVNVDDHGLLQCMLAWLAGTEELAEQVEPVHRHVRAPSTLQVRAARAVAGSSVRKRVRRQKHPRQLLIPYGQQHLEGGIEMEIDFLKICQASTSVAASLDYAKILSQCFRIPTESTVSFRSASCATSEAKPMSFPPMLSIM